MVDLPTQVYETIDVQPEGLMTRLSMEGVRTRS